MGGFPENPFHLLHATMRRLFGMAPKETAPPPPGPSLEEANTKLQGRSQAIHAKIEQIDRDLLKYKAEWKKNPRNNMAKQRCVNLLKQKKQYESQVIQMDNQAFNMDQIQIATEQAESTIAMVGATKEAMGHLKQQFEAPEMDLDAILDMQAPHSRLPYPNAAHGVLGAAPSVSPTKTLATLTRSTLTRSPPLRTTWRKS